MLIFSLVLGCGAENNSAENIEEVEQVTDTNMEFQREYYEVIDTAIEQLRSGLKNPSSLDIKAIVVDVYVEEKNANVYIRFTAQNGFGANLDDSFAYFSLNGLSGFESTSGSYYSGDWAFKRVKGEDTEEGYTVEIAEGFWGDNKDPYGATKVAFKVDMNDYKIPEQY